MCATDCVLVGLDWDELMMLFVLHVTCSCISHAYVLSFQYILIYLNYIWDFFIVSLSPFLRLRWSASMAPKRKSAPCWNPIRFGASFSADTTPFSVWFCDEKSKSDFF